MYVFSMYICIYIYIYNHPCTFFDWFCLSLQIMQQFVHEAVCKHEWDEITQQFPNANQDNWNCDGQHVNISSGESCSLLGPGAITKVKVAIRTMVMAATSTTSTGLLIVTRHSARHVRERWKRAHGSKGKATLGRPSANGFCCSGWPGWKIEPGAADWQLGL